MKPSTKECIKAQLIGYPGLGGGLFFICHDFGNHTENTHGVFVGLMTLLLSSLYANSKYKEYKALKNQNNKNIKTK